MSKAVKKTTEMWQKTTESRAKRELVKPGLTETEVMWYEESSSNTA